MALRKAYTQRRSEARHAFKDHQADRERYERKGLGPGEAYRGMWAYLHEMLDHLNATQDEKRKDYFRREYITTLKAILPYERPRLQTIQLQGDPDRPVLSTEQMADAIAKLLTPDEISILDRVALKLVTSSSGSPLFDADGNPIGGAAPAGGGREAPGGTGRRKAKG